MRQEKKYGAKNYLGISYQVVDTVRLKRVVAKNWHGRHHIEPKRGSGRRRQSERMKTFSYWTAGVQPRRSAWNLPNGLWEREIEIPRALFDVTHDDLKITLFGKRYILSSIFCYHTVFSIEILWFFCTSTFRINCK